MSRLCLSLQHTLKESAKVNHLGDALAADQQALVEAVRAARVAPPGWLDYFVITSVSGATFGLNLPDLTLDLVGAHVLKVAGTDPGVGSGTIADQGPGWFEITLSGMTLAVGERIRVDYTPLF